MPAHAGESGVGSLLRLPERPGGRGFYDFQDGQDAVAALQDGDRGDRGDRGKQALLGLIRRSVIGAEAVFHTPFALQRRLVYCDYTASGRALSFIEDYVREEVLPFYGNTHTTTSATGLQTTFFRHEARDIIKRAVNAAEEEDVLIFTGSGSTCAITKLRDALKLQAGAERALVFVGPYEHHSNLLPWREGGVDVVTIPEDDCGNVCLAARPAAQSASRSLRRALLNVTGQYRVTLSLR